MRRSALLACLLVACGGGGSGIDGGSLDAGRVPLDRAAPPDDVTADVLDAPSCEGTMTHGCPCSDPGYTRCIGGTGVQCCSGQWWDFHDGPCAPPPDGGTETCDTPTGGCPCTTEGEVHCRTFRWRLVCTSGTWRDDYGHVCC